MPLTTLKKNIRHMIFLTMLFVLSGFVVSLIYMSVHEQVHATIFNSYGISSVSKEYLFTASTQPTNVSEYNEKCDSYCHLANNETDVVGYHAIVIIFGMFALFYIIEIYKLAILEIKKEPKDSRELKT